MAFGWFAVEKLPRSDHRHQWQISLGLPKKGNYGDHTGVELVYGAPAKELWAWNAEGWYVTLQDSHLLAFTSEYRTSPPREVTGLFQEIEILPGQPQLFAIRDVRLGFCYDPVAALGFWYSNQPAFAVMRCRN